ncbi:MAG: MFS transporter [Deltaproteobacteria bacterium]|jgi:sugar phosphate permease|nr:MFS transporter [Deltaproteobacteria bacterium]
MTSRIHWAWVILTASFATIFIHYSIRLGYGILMPEMIQSLQISKAQAGTIASSFYLAYGIFSPIMGFAVDRFNSRILLTVCSAILATGTYFMSRPETLSQACFAFFIAGVGASAMWTPVVTLVQRWYGANRRGLALGILSVSYAIGYGVMGIAIPPVVAAYGWRACWLILALFSFLLVPLNGILLRNRPRDLNLNPWGEGEKTSVPVSPDQGKKRVPYRRLLGMPSLWFAAVSYLFIGFTAYLVNLFIVTYGNLELKYSFSRAAQLASGIAFGGIAGAFLLPLLSDYIGRKKCVLIINAGMTASILLILWAGNAWSSLFAAACIFGVFYAAAWPMYAAAAADFFPREATGTVLGFWTIFYGFSLVVAPALGGYIADQTGTFRYSFLVAIFTGCLAVLFFLPVKSHTPPAGPGIYPREFTPPQ